MTRTNREVEAKTMEAMVEEEGLRELMPEEYFPIVEAKLSALASSDPRHWDGVMFPIDIAVEIAAVCNLDCVMCPVPTTSRPKTLMKPEVFQSVVDQIAEEKGIVFLPQGFGETMLHVKWAEMLAYAVGKGVRPIVMLTNGTLLNEKNVERVLELGIDAVVISIDGTTPETYASVRVGGDLVKVEQNVRRLLERRGDSATPRLMLRIIRMNETKAEIDAFFDRWQPLLRDGDVIRVNEYNDWSGKVDDRSVDGPAESNDRHPCRMLWRNLSVHADGKVSACCHDSEDELIVGDLTKGDTIGQIWNGEALAELRRIHVEGRVEELPICANCRNWG